MKIRSGDLNSLVTNGNDSQLISISTPIRSIRTSDITEDVGRSELGDSPRPGESGSQLRMVRSGHEPSELAKFCWRGFIKLIDVKPNDH